MCSVIDSLLRRATTDGTSSLASLLELYDYVKNARQNRLSKYVGSVWLAVDKSHQNPVVCVST